MRNAKQYITAQVRQLQPGQEIRVSDLLLKEIHGMNYNGAIFSPADIVLGGIIGSAYEFGYREDYATRSIVFFRLEKPLTDGRQTFVDPDRRDWYAYDGTFYTHKNEA